MTLAQIKQKYNISRRAIQGYEKYGLVKPTGKTKRGYLTYDEDAVQRIRDIKLYQNMGFKVKEIGSLIDASDDIILEALTERKEQLLKSQEEISDLIELIDQLISEL